MAKDAIRALAAVTVLAICGCSGQQVEPPHITGRVKNTISQPVAPLPTAPAWRPTSDYPAGWIPSPAKEKRWKAIIIHHSATDSGNVATFDDYHRNGNNWDGIGYDFVIGNGRGSGDGQVEVTYRWRDQVAGAHVGGTPENWANVDGIGICLVGDFTKTKPTWSQMNSLKQLVRFLQQRYRIPTSRVYGHTETPGYSRGSVCPGHKFPMATFKNSL